MLMPMPDKIGWSSLSLTAKALILLSIPLCLQLGLGLILIQLQQETEAEVQRTNDARAIATEVNSILSDMGKLCRLSLTAKGKWPKEFQGYEGYTAPQNMMLIRRIQKQYIVLDQLTSKKPELNRTVKLSYQPFNEAFQMIEGAQKEILAGHLDQVMATSWPKTKLVEDLANSFMSQELVILAKNQEDLVKNSRMRQSEIRQMTVNCSFAVILANIVFTVLLAKFLVQTIILRLRLIAENAIRLAAHQPLLPPIAGGDEIAELEQIFHTMAHTIDQSTQAKQDLYNMITHDLRTPLAAIQGSLEMLAFQAGQFSTPSKKLINEAARNSARTTGLVNDLLDSQKLEAGMLELNATTVYLEDVFEYVNLDIEGWIGEFGLHISFPSTEVKVSANQDMLNRIIFNLISNAIKHSPRGSTITVNVRPASKMAEITVMDQAPGIPKHALKTLFDPSFRDSSSNPIPQVGSGLGLSICQDFVNLHGGRIWATSNPGQGNTFHFTVPIA
jgi:signal transduction histidine kinase